VYLRAGWPPSVMDEGKKKKIRHKVTNLALTLTPIGEKGEKALTPKKNKHPPMQWEEEGGGEQSSGVHQSCLDMTQNSNRGYGVAFFLNHVEKKKKEERGKGFAFVPPTIGLERDKRGGKGVYVWGAKVVPMQGQRNGVARGCRDMDPAGSHSISRERQKKGGRCTETRFCVRWKVFKNEMYKCQSIDFYPSDQMKGGSTLFWVDK